MTESEYKTLVEQSYSGALLIGIDRAVVHATQRNVRHFCLVCACNRLPFYPYLRVTLSPLVLRRFHLLTVGIASRLHCSYGVH